MYFACDHLPTASRIHFDFQHQHSHYEIAKDNFPGILFLSSSLDEHAQLIHGENDIVIDFSLRKCELDEIDAQQIAGWFNIGWFKISLSQLFENYLINVNDCKNRKIYVPLLTADDLGCVDDIHLELIFEITNEFVAAHFKSIQMFPHRLFQLSNLFKYEIMENIFVSN